ncbi:hypothetical protein C8R47DRAFT_70510 [Mycena vitilis]|nr:hypothetical protein C8R47DRAFT_70510 [Mycena vitilis]
MTPAECHIFQFSISPFLPPSMSWRRSCGWFPGGCKYYSVYPILPSGHALRCMLNLPHQEVVQFVPTLSTQFCVRYICIKIPETARLYGTVYSMHFLWSSKLVYILPTQLCGHVLPSPTQLCGCIHCTDAALRVLSLVPTQLCGYFLYLPTQPCGHHPFADAALRAILHVPTQLCGHCFSYVPTQLCGYSFHLPTQLCGHFVGSFVSL